jgi:fructoselysine-6-P-deglycase FrlB-like protein
MTDRMRSTGLWQDTLEVPAALRRTLDQRDGFAEVAELARSPGVRRLVVSGNGASHYVAHGLWLTALAGEPAPVELIPVPAGLLARGAFRWRDGDLLLAISSSGELRDLIEAIESPGFRGPYAAVTAAPDSTIGAGAAARALVHVPEQRAVTHTHAFCGALVAGLAIWAEIAGDESLAASVARAPSACAGALEATESWAPTALSRLDVPSAGAVMGSGPGWTAALEGALLVKEVAQIPCEGVETRDAATATMTALAGDHLVLSLAAPGDALAEEAEAICERVGATILRAPAEAHSDPRIAAVTTFPPAVALSIRLAQRRGLDPDTPSWTRTYYATARKRS